MITNLPQEARHSRWCHRVPKSAEHVQGCSEGTILVHTTSGYLEQIQCSQVPPKPEHKPHMHRDRTIYFA